MNITNIILGMGFLFFINVPTLSAQLGVVEGSLPLDPSIRHGKLANGFTYYIKYLENAPEKINMHLYVKTGTLHQQQDQLNFAHALEHLAFKCAPNFPINLLNNPELLVSLGMKKYDIDARTEALCTPYYFNIPSNNINALDTGLLWFHDISALNLTTKKINKERGPLRQEVTFRQGSKIEDWFVESNMESQLFPFKLDWSNFFDHNSDFSPSSLRAFYKQWYRPDRMGLVIVGDISNIDLIESKIKSRFSDLKGHSKPWTDTHMQYLKKPNKFVVVEQNKGKYGKVTETVEFYLYLRDKKLKEERNSWRALQRELIWGMLGKLTLLNDRFKAEGNSYISSFSAFGSSPSPAFPAYTIKVTSKSNQGREALQKTIRILIQAKEFGFTQGEWEIAKNKQLTAMKTVDTTISKYWMQEIKDHFVYETALPTGKNTGLQRWLTRLSLVDFNTLIEQYFSDIVNDIGVIVPHGQNSMYSEAKVRGWIEEVLEEVPQPYLVPEVPRQLLSSYEISTLKEVSYRDMDNPAVSPALKNGRILKKVKPLGVWELVLENGIKVVIDTSGPKNKRVYLHGFSPKGASSFPEEDYFSAINAPLIIKNTGVGEMDKFELERFLATTSFWQGVFPYIDDKETGITGNADLKDFEKLLQLVYLYFTEPRKDQEAFEDWKLKERNRYLVDGTNSFILVDHMTAMADILGDRSAPKGTRRFHGTAKTHVERAYSIYTELYSNAADFTFLISGDFSKKKVLPLILKYLGNLPHLPDTEIHLPKILKNNNLSKGPLYYKYSPQDMGAFYDMESIIYSLRFVVRTVNPADWKEQIKVEALGALMDSKIKELRYSKGFAVFTPRVFGGLNRNLSSYDIEIRLDVIPKELEDLRKVTKEMVSEIKNYSFTEARFKEVIQNRFLNKYKGRQKSTFQRLLQLHNFYVYNEPWITLSESEIQRYIESLTQEDIQETSQKYLNEAYLTEFVMQNKSSNHHP